MSPPRLRVMTYNVRAYRDDWRAAAEVIARVEPDVLCLQEVSRRLWPGARTRELAERAGLNWPEGRTRGGGTAVLTAPDLPVYAVGYARLPVPWLRGLREGVRSCSWVEVALPGQASTARRVTVASVHLSLVADERLRHVELIRTGVPSADQLVIAGDINEDDAGAAWRILGERGWTRLVSPLRPTFPAGEPVRCLDAVFASPGLVPVPAAAGREPGDTDLEGLMSRASDHRPLWVDLTHTKPRAG